MSQAEMAEYLRLKLAAVNDSGEEEVGKYPTERTYARWESLNSQELPQSWKKLTAVASAMSVDLSDLIAPMEPGETPQFLVIRRLDTIIDILTRLDKEVLENQKKILALLTKAFLP